VIRLSSMGDIILTTPALTALKAHYPRVQLDFVVKERYAELFQGHPHVDNLLPLSQRDGLLSMGCRLRRQHHHIVLDLHANLRSRALTAILPAPRKLRYRKRTIRRWAMVRLGYRPQESPHVVDLYLRSLRPLGIEPSGRRPRLYLLESEREFQKQFYLRHRLGDARPVVGLHPGARWPGKRWPEERFIQLGQRLREERRAQILVFGGAGEEDLGARVAQGLEPDAPMALNLTLRQLMALISGCALFITNDSGPMHMATALEVPVVAIFGPTQPSLGFWPLGAEDAVLTAQLTCSPCSLHGEKRCPQGNWLCLKRIGVQDVLQAALGILDRRRKAIEKNNRPV